MPDLDLIKQAKQAECGRSPIRSGCSFRGGRPTIVCSVFGSRSSLRRVICDRVAAKIVPVVGAAASGSEANGLYLAQELTS
jgi:hypothetical protein